MQFIHVKPVADADDGVGPSVHQHFFEYKFVDAASPLEQQLGEAHETRIRHMFLIGDGHTLCLFQKELDITRKLLKGKRIVSESEVVLLY